MAWARRRLRALRLRSRFRAKRAIKKATRAYTPNQLKNAATGLPKKYARVPIVVVEEG